MGKTSVALNCAKAAAEANVPVCFYSLEMSDDRLTDNLLLSLCDVDKDRFKNGLMSPEDWTELTEAKLKLNKLPIYIDPNPSVSMRYVKANSRVMHRKGKCGIIFIDYLQLADVGLEERNRNREQEIAQASRQAKIIAKELNVPVVLLSQLNRAVESRTNRKPQLSDLRESGAIEQDADLVAFIYRPEYYGFKEDEQGKSLIGVGKIIISKHRNGSCEDVRFSYNESMTHITDYIENNNTPF
jgi:replicative DNA helicase